MPGIRQLVGGSGERAAARFLRRQGYAIIARNYRCPAGEVDLIALDHGTVALIDLKSPEYLKIYPMGKTPSLEVNGQMIGESEIINEYLEEKFPQPPLLPKEPEARARTRTISRFHDLYFEPPLRALFPQVSAKEK